MLSFLNFCYYDLFLANSTFDAQTISSSLKATKNQPHKRFDQKFLHDTSLIRQIDASIRLERHVNLIKMGQRLHRPDCNTYDLSEKQLSNAYIIVSPLGRFWV